jgi:predicted TIM-barrel fold metal-dependent hydrolase
VHFWDPGRFGYDWLPAEHALAVFGEEHCLYGSDWPLTRDHRRWRTAVHAIAPGTLDNARAVYGL